MFTSIIFTLWISSKQKATALQTSDGLCTDKQLCVLTCFLGCTKLLCQLNLHPSAGRNGSCQLGGWPLLAVAAAVPTRAPAPPPPNAAGAASRAQGSPAQSLSQYHPSLSPQKQQLSLSPSGWQSSVLPIPLKRIREPPCIPGALSIRLH